MRIGIHTGMSTNTATTPADGLLLRLTDAARLLSCSRRTLYDMIDRGDLPYVRLSSDRRIDRREIDRYIARQTVRKGE